VAVDPRPRAPSVRERHDRAATLEIVPLLSVEHREKFGVVEPVDLAVNAAGTDDQSGIAAEVEQTPADRAVAEQGRPRGQHAIEREASHQDPMKVQWKKQSGPLLVSSVNLVSAKTRKRGADDDQSDPHRRVYGSDRAVPVPRLRAGEQRVEARVHDRARGPAARAHDAGARSRAAD